MWSLSNSLQHVLVRVPLAYDLDKLEFSIATPDEV